MKAWIVYPTVRHRVHDEIAHPGNTTLQIRHVKPRVKPRVKPAKCMVSMNGDHYYDVT